MTQPDLIRAAGVIREAWRSSQETNGPRTPAHPHPHPHPHQPCPCEGSHGGNAETQSDDSVNAFVALKAASASRAEICSLLADELLQVKGHQAGSGVATPWVTRCPARKLSGHRGHQLPLPMPVPSTPSAADMHLEAPGTRAESQRGARSAWDAGTVERRARSPRRCVPL